MLYICTYSHLNTYIVIIHDVEFDKPFMKVKYWKIQRGKIRFISIILYLISANNEIFALYAFQFIIHSRNSAVMKYAALYRVIRTDKIKIKIFPKNFCNEITHIRKFPDAPHIYIHRGMHEFVQIYKNVIKTAFSSQEKNFRVILRQSKSTCTYQSRRKMRFRMHRKKRRKFFRRLIRTLPVSEEQKGRVWGRGCAGFCGEPFCIFTDTNTDLIWIYVACDCVFSVCLPARPNALRNLQNARGKMASELTTENFIPNATAILTFNQNN